MIGDGDKDGDRDGDGDGVRHGDAMQDGDGGGDGDGDEASYQYNVLGAHYDSYEDMGILRQHSQREDDAFHGSHDQV